MFFLIRSLIKQIKDKTEHRDRLEADLKKDESRRLQLEKQIEVRNMNATLKITLDLRCLFLKWSRYFVGANSGIGTSKDRNR